MKNIFYTILFITLCHTIMAQPRTNNLTLGQAAYAEKKYELAVQYFSQILGGTNSNANTGHPFAIKYRSTTALSTDTSVLHLMANACTYTRRYDMAENYYSQLYSQNTNANISEQFADVLVLNAKYAEAKKILTSANSGSSKSKLLLNKIEYAIKNPSTVTANSTLPGYATCFNANTGNIWTINIDEDGEAEITKNTSKGALEVDADLPEGMSLSYFCVNKAETKLYATLYSGNIYNGTYQIYSFDIVNNQLKNAMALPVSVNAAGSVNQMPSLSNDEKTLYFVSNRAGGKGGMDIYKTDINFATVYNISAINTLYNEVSPSVSATNAFYYSTDGGNGYGGYDVYSANIIGNEIEAGTNAGNQVNSSRNDICYTAAGNSFWLCTDNFGCKECGVDNCLYSINGTITILEYSAIAINKLNNQAIPNATVEFMDANGKLIQKYTADANGKYSLPLVKNEKYTIKITHPGYIDNTTLITTPQILTTDYIENQKLGLYPYYKQSVIVTDNQSNNPLANSKVIIIETGKTLNTDANGKVDISELDPTKTYTAVVTKDGYLTGNFKLNPIKVIPNEANWGLTKVKLNTVFSMASLDPVFYETGKYELPAGKTQGLDSVLVFLEQNPTLVIEIGSHTDNVGSDASNNLLSQRRAETLVKYFISKGISPQKLRSRGYGETKPIATNTTPEGKAQNRRSDLKIVGIK